MSPAKFEKRAAFWVAGIAVLALLAALLLRGKPRPPSEKLPPNLGARGPCPGKTETYTMSDAYLPGLIERGQEFRVTWNWYACHAPVSGEIALVRLSRSLPPKARVIRAAPGDSLSVTKDASGSRWNLSVNGKLVTDFEGKPYAFGGALPPPIQRYVESVGNVLRPGAVVVLSTRSPGDGDSGLFGVTGVDDLVGRVERR